MLSKLRMFVTVAFVAGLISTAAGRNPVAADSQQDTKPTDKNNDAAKQSTSTNTKPKGEPLSEDRMSTRGLHPPRESQKGKTKKAAHPPAKPAPKEPK